MQTQQLDCNYKRHDGHDANNNLSFFLRCGKKTNYTSGQFQPVKTILREATECKSGLFKEKLTRKPGFAVVLKTT